jgi:hypothetical protein
LWAARLESKEFELKMTLWINLLTPRLIRSRLGEECCLVWADARLGPLMVKMITGTSCPWAVSPNRQQPENLTQTDADFFSAVIRACHGQIRLELAILGRPINDIELDLMLEISLLTQRLSRSCSINTQSS